MQSAMELEAEHQRGATQWPGLTSVVFRFHFFATYLLAKRVMQIPAIIIISVLLIV
jgi:hypothetical protein